MKKYVCLILAAVALLTGCSRLAYLIPEAMVHITYRAADGTAMTDGEWAHTAAYMEQRLTAVAVTDFKISTDTQAGTLTVDVPRRHYPGNLTTLADNWGSRGVLAICIDEDGGDPPLPPEGVVLDNSHVASAQAVSAADGFCVELTFTEEGAEILANTTKRLTAVQGTMPIWMDWQIVSTPQVMQPITDGAALVSGFASWEAASLFAAKLNGYPFPCDLVASVDFSDAE